MNAHSFRQIVIIKVFLVALLEEKAYIEYQSKYLSNFGNRVVFERIPPDRERLHIFKGILLVILTTQVIYFDLLPVSLLHVSYKVVSIITVDTLDGHCREADCYDARSYICQIEIIVLVLLSLLVDTDELTELPRKRKLLAYLCSERELKLFLDDVETFKFLILNLNLFNSLRYFRMYFYLVDQLLDVGHYFDHNRVLFLLVIDLDDYIWLLGLSGVVLEYFDSLILVQVEYNFLLFRDSVGNDINMKGIDLFRWKKIFNYLLLLILLEFFHFYIFSIMT